MPSFRRLIEAVRRASGTRSTYDWSIFCARPVETLTPASLTGERPEGGWRGYAGAAIERKWTDIFTIDVFLTSQRPSLIIELGTGSGAFSCYLATYAHLNGARFCTFDSHRRSAPTKRPNYRALRLIRRLGGRVHHRDIFDPSTRQLIRSLITRAPSVFVYCDNGDKPREIHTFVDDLKEGDFVGVHDYGSEIHERDLSGLLDTSLSRWNPDFFSGLSSSNRIFRKTAPR